jgi:hypothetical protein
MTRSTVELRCDNCDTLLKPDQVSYCDLYLPYPDKVRVKAHMRRRLGGYCPEPCGPVRWRTKPLAT